MMMCHFPLLPVGRLLRGSRADVRQKKETHTHTQRTDLPSQSIELNRPESLLIGAIASINLKFPANFSNNLSNEWRTIYQHSAKITNSFHLEIIMVGMLL
jgi:hypothetical protein